MSDNPRIKTPPVLPRIDTSRIDYVLDDVKNFLNVVAKYRLESPTAGEDYSAALEAATEILEQVNRHNIFRDSENNGLHRRLVEQALFNPSVPVRSLLRNAIKAGIKYKTERIDLAEHLLAGVPNTRLERGDREWICSALAAIGKKAPYAVDGRKVYVAFKELVARARTDKERRELRSEVKAHCEELGKVVPVTSFQRVKATVKRWVSRERRE